MACRPGAPRAARPGNSAAHDTPSEHPVSREQEQASRDGAGMALALDQAQNAWLVGEVPVGAVILRNGQLIADRKSVV